MAVHTYTVYANKSAAIDSRNPNTNYSTGTSIECNHEYDWVYSPTDYPTWSARNAVRRFALFGFDGAAAQLAGKTLKTLVLYWYVNSYSVSGPSGTTGAVAPYPIGGAWVESTVNGNSPIFASWPGRGGIAPATGAWASYDYSSRLNEATTIVNYGVLLEMVAAYIGSTASHVSANAVFPSSRATSNKPYIVITAEDSTPTVTTISPKNEYVSETSETVFSWNYANATGGVQGSYILQYSYDNGTTWTQLSAASTAETAYTAPAGTFAQAGNLLWRVRVTSQWGIQSDWSEPALVVVRAAPSVGITSATNTPRPTVEWQSVGQQAFHLRAGGYDSGVRFGTEKSFKVPVYLPDGSTEISLRVQNSFGIWSDWAVRVIYITNVPGTAINLSVTATHDAALEWTTAGAYARYYVYRDGLLIGSTTADVKSYTDILAVGKHSYQIRGAGAGSENYTLSNAADATLKCDYPMITALGAADWIPLKYSTEILRSVNVRQSQDITFQHYSGKTLPVAETSGNREKSLSIDVAFMKSGRWRDFENLIGKIVCYKDMHENICIGIMSGFGAMTQKYYRWYNCEITAIDFKEADGYVV